VGGISIQSDLRKSTILDLASDGLLANNLSGSHSHFMTKMGQGGKNKVDF
jgi:hypothetical protein